MPNPIHIAYDEWMTADKAWHAELRRVFRSAAGDARYDARGRSTDTLATLAAEFDRCRVAYDAAVYANQHLIFRGPR